MKINRREFLLLSVGLAAVGSLANASAAPAAVKERLVNAGAISKFAADGVYRDFRDQGFFVVRKADKLFALSAICTHRKCKLTAEPDRSFNCQCHGSTFDPARSDLPTLPTHVNEQGQLVVNVPAA